MGWGDRGLHKKYRTANHLASFDRTSLFKLDCNLVGTPYASAAWPTPRKLKQAHGQIRMKRKKEKYYGSHQNFKTSLVHPVELSGTLGLRTNPGTGRGRVNWRK